MLKAKYTINLDGTVDTDSAEAALAMARLMVAQSKPREAHVVTGRSAPAPKPAEQPEAPHEEESAIEPEAPQRSANAEGWSRFVELLKDKQREVLRVIKTHDNITLADLVKILGAEHTSSVAGYITGIIRNAEKANIKMTDVYRRSEQGYGPKRVVRYKPGALLRAHDVPA